MSTETTTTDDEQDHPPITADDPYALISRHASRRRTYHTRTCQWVRAMESPKRHRIADLAARDGFEECEFCQRKSARPETTFDRVGDTIATDDTGTVIAAHRPDGTVADGTVGKRARTIIPRHARALATLPDPGVVFVREFADVTESVWKRCWHAGLLVDHGQTCDIEGIGPPTSRRTNRGHVVEVGTAVHERIQSVVTDLPDHPCADAGHQGVRTLDADAGVYSCTTDACDRTFGRDVAERILGGDGA